MGRAGLNEGMSKQKARIIATRASVLTDCVAVLQCPCRCPVDQRKRLHQLAAGEGVLLNAQDVANILNSKFVIRNEEVRGSSPLTSTIIVIVPPAFEFLCAVYLSIASSVCVA